ncbi:MAG: cytochrome c oxidase subunit II [Chloroflexi bacterium]|nr:cytochrome c oxidase subunit II [Chloroflexota bacterium]
MQRFNRPSRRLLALAILGLVFVLATASCASNPQSTFDARGPVAQVQLEVLFWIFGAGLAVFILVEGAIIYIVMKYRRKSDADPDPEQTHGNTRLEVAWTIAPVVLLIIVAVPTIAAIFETATAPLTPEEGGLQIEAIGHQWWFEFRYDDPNSPGEQIVTANEMHIPVGEPVTVMLGSVDVIHSFWVPKLAGKVDMIPNNDNSLWLQADVPGEIWGQCAEFCGISHANMRFRVIAQERPDYDAWLQAQARPAASPFDPLAAEGQRIFTSRGGCAACHSTQSTVGPFVPVGPNLTHFASRGTMAAAIMDNTQQNLREWLSNPEEIKPGNIMARQAPVFNGQANPLTEAEISALVAYLRTLE